MLAVALIVYLLVAWLYWLCIYRSNMDDYKRCLLSTFELFHTALWSLLWPIHAFTLILFRLTGYKNG